MALPKLNLPTYKHFLTGLNKEVTYRPFTNKEQKILLLAKESEDKKQVINSVKQILGLCIVDDIDVDDLSSFDVEDIFLRIRSKSVEEQIKPRYKYEYKNEDDETKEETITLIINLDDVKVVRDPKHKTIIDLDSTYKLEMRYPTYKDLEFLDSNTEEEQKTIVLRCIKSVFSNDEVIVMENETDEEKDEFYDSLSNKVMLDIKQFFDTMPKLYHEIEVKKKDGTKETVRFEGLNDFFI